MATVSIQNITKYYGDIRAVDGVNLDVKDKEFLTILGPSGCGKTTLLRLLAGLEAPTKGDILVDGISIIDIPTRERDVAMVFQSYSLYNHMTVYDNIAFPLKMRKLSAQDIESKVKAASELLELQDVLKRKPGKLSGGEQQRVALGRSIVREPKVFLMDEPLTFLDPKIRTQMRIEIKSLQRKLGVTTIYVTHDQVEAMTMSDRIGLLDKGILQQVGTPSEVYRKPTNTFVGSFLGSPAINFMNCSYLEKDGKVFLDADYVKIDVTYLKELIGKKNGSELILGVRPEEIAIVKEKSADSIEAEVFMTEPLGSEIIVILKIGENIVRAKVEPGTIIKIGDKVNLNINKKKIHIFNKSGEAIC
ncbi:MAG: ABC transporter ATP-binding protein [Nitrososphaerales archaeon]|nr:ABC transporter ATP-binding protein [Nitrososphaerales archaeon]